MRGPSCRKRWKRLCRGSGLARLVRAEAHISRRKRPISRLDASITESPYVKLGRNPAVHILIAGPPLCFLMNRMRRARWDPKSLPTVTTLRCSPSSSSREARRLARNGLEACQELEVALGEWISMGLCVPIASKLMSSTHW